MIFIIPIKPGSQNVLIVREGVLDVRVVMTVGNKLTKTTDTFLTMIRNMMIRNMSEPISKE